MSIRRTSKRRLAVLTAAGATCAVVANLLVGGSSSADQRTLNLTYTCPLPIVGSTQIPATVTADVPSTIHVGEPTPEFPISATATTPANVTDALNLFQAKTVDGSVLARATLTAPDRSDPVDTTLTISPPAQVPASGPITATASGTAPSQRPATAPGEATITVGTIKLSLTPRTADGGTTPLGTVVADCTLNPGQDTLLARIQILPAGDSQPPTAPGNAHSTGSTTDSVSLAWDASTDNVGVVGYDVFNGADLATTVTGTNATVTGLTADTAFTFTVKARDAAGNVSPASAAVAVRTQPSPDTQPPTAPGNLRSTGTTTDSVSLAWDASTDNTAVTGYEVFNGANLATTVTDTTATITGLTADTAFTFTVKARDAAGNRSPASAAVNVRTQPPAADTQPPTAPGNFRSTGTTSDNVSLVWDASTDNVGVVGYDVFNGATNATSVTGTTATVTGLAPDTAYTFTVKAKDAAGNVSAASAAVMARTQAPPSNTIKISFDLTGSTLIKKVNGTVPLKGSIDAELELSTGNFLSDLNLNPTKGNFKILGFVPASANIEFVQVGRTSGKFTAPSTLEASSKVTVKLPKVSLFGFPISQSSRCMTSKPSDINLKSTTFDPLKGGTASGTYTLAPLTGCGLFNGLISALTTGPGNTITVDLKAKPATLRR